MNDELATAIAREVSEGRAPNRTAYIIAAIETALGKQISLPKLSSRSRKFVDPGDEILPDGRTVRERQENIEWVNMVLRKRATKLHFGLETAKDFPPGHEAASWNYTNLADMAANGVDTTGLK